MQFIILFPSRKSVAFERVNKFTYSQQFWLVSGLPCLDGWLPARASVREPAGRLLACCCLACSLAVLNFQLLLLALAGPAGS